MKTTGIAPAALALLLAGAAFAQDETPPPGGGYTITNPDPATTVVTQSVDKVIINWQSFGVAEGETMRFVQPGSTSIALNRVLGSDPSLILGSIEANGRIFLLNPNGILFGQGSCVNVGGIFASTLSITDDDFLSGNYRFFQDPTKPLSYVVNQGSIHAREFAALAAPFVENSGGIFSAGGKVYMLGSSEVFLDLRGDGLIGYSIGTATGGTVHIRGDALSDVMRAVVNSSGIVEAGAVVERPDGVIELVGAEGIAINRGIISVSGGNGLVALDSARGTVTTRLSRIAADGIGENSNGGSVFILSRGDTFFDGFAFARGGETGDGGFIEVSGVSRLRFIGYADATAAAGAGGTVVIDPEILVIANGGPSVNDPEAGDGVILVGEGAGQTWTVSENALEALPGNQNLAFGARVQIIMNDLADNNLALATTAGFTVTFTVSDPPAANGDPSDIVWNAGDTISTQGGNVVMISADDIGNGLNAANPVGSIVTNGGSVTLTAASANTESYINVTDILTGGGNITITANRHVTARNLTAPGGVINIRASATAMAVGSIFQAPGGVWTSNDLILRAADGITRTDGTAVITNVNRLHALNIGDINGRTTNPMSWPTRSIIISNQGPVELIDLSGSGFAIRNDAMPEFPEAEFQVPASIQITAAGNMTLSGTVAVMSNLVPITLRTTNGGSILDDGNQTTSITGLQVAIPNFGTSGGQPVITLEAAGSIGSGASLASYVDVGRFGTLNATSGANIFITRVSDGALTTGSGDADGEVAIFTNGAAVVGTLAFVNLSGNLTVNNSAFANHNDQLILGAVGNLIVAAPGVVSINSSGPAGTTGILLWATGDVLQTGGTIQGGTSSAAGGDRRVEIQADSNLAASVGSPSDNVGLINKTGGTLIAGDLVASAATGINFNNFNALRFQATNRTSGNIAATDTNTLALADIDALGWAVSNVGAGNITISVLANDMTVLGDVRTDSGNIALTANRHLLDDGVQTTEVSTTGNITLTATTGSIGTYNGANFSGFFDVGTGFATLTATATGGGAGNGNVLIAQVEGPGGPDDLTTTALNVVITPNANGIYGLVNYAGDLIIGAPISRAGGIILGGNGALDIGDTITSTASFVVLASTDDVDVNADVSAATRVTIEADSPKFLPDIAPDGAGAVTQAGGTSISGVELVAYAGTGIALPRVTVGTLQATNAGSGDIDITETDGVILADITGLGYAVSNTGGGNITIETLAGNIVLNGSVLADSGDITLIAFGSILDDGLQNTVISTGGGAIVLEAMNGDIGSYNGVNFNGFVDFTTGFSTLDATAAGHVYLSQVGPDAGLSYTDITITVGAGMNLGLVNLVGSLTIDAPVATGGNIIFGARDNLAIDASVSTTAMSILLAAGGNVTGSGDVSVAAGRLAIAADSALFGSNNVGLIDLDGTLTADELVATAATGINLPGLVVNALQANNRAAGNVFIIDAGDTVLAVLTTGTDAVSAASGNVTVESGGSLTLAADVRASGSVTLTAAGDLNQSLGNDVFAGGSIAVTTGGDQNLALLWSGGAVTLVAGGSIFDNNDDGGIRRLNVRALADSSFSAGGTIGRPNCLEVDIRGSLTVLALGMLDGESICLVGRIDGGLIIDPNTPGEVDFIEVTAQPDQDPKRPDPIIQVPLLDKNIWPPRLVEMTIRKRPIPTKK